MSTFSTQHSAFSIPDDPHAQLRRSVYLLLIVVGTGAILGRILAVEAVDRRGVQEHLLSEIPAELARKERDLRSQGFEGERLKKALAAAENSLRRRAQLARPFLSANDRSRWCTVRALVEADMQVPGYPYAIDKVIQEPNWDTIDMVKHDGHLYSSKPPLLPTLMAAEYWVIYRLTGMSLATNPYWVGRLMLVTFNVFPLVIYFLLLASLVERFGQGDWGRLFVMAAAVFGTFLSTFAVTINNHLPAAICALAALYAAVRIWFDGQRRLRWFLLAGLFAALTAANELPALALFAGLGAALLWKAPRQTIVGFVPAATVVVAAFFGTNWIPHHSLLPPYMHSGPASKRAPQSTEAEPQWQPKRLAEVNLDQLEKSTDPNDWYDYYYVRNGVVHRSHWVQRTGPDRGEPLRYVYALHVLVGHHGIFSLTPIWLLSVWGAVLWLWQRRDGRLREVALLIAALSVVCLAFHLLRGQVDRNYGGLAAGFRWMFWFAPLWLLVMLPAADAMSRRWWARLIALLMLAASVLSASYPTWNPWTPPWIWDYLDYLGLVG